MTSGGEIPPVTTLGLWVGPNCGRTTALALRIRPDDLTPSRLAHQDRACRKIRSTPTGGKNCNDLKNAAISMTYDFRLAASAETANKAAARPANGALAPGGSRRRAA